MKDTTIRMFQDIFYVSVQLAGTVIAAIIMAAFTVGAVLLIKKVFEK